MCGRFALGKNTDEINDELDLVGEDGQEHLPNFNVAPTMSTPVVIQDTRRRLVTMRWGLIPSWSKDQRIGARMINARSETLPEKPSFRNLIGRRHCAVVADGYYEWHRSGKNKTPFFIRPAAQNILLMAGLWDVWAGPGNEPIQSFTIITRSPAKSIATIHDRMPVILSPERAALWLRQDPIPSKDLRAFLSADIGVELEAYPVSKTVNSVRNNSPDCMQRVTRPQVEANGDELLL